MKFTRRKRIALEVLGPPALGAFLTSAILAVVALVDALEEGDYGHQLTQVAELAILAVMFGYMLAGVQSILYALIMEWRFARGLDPRSWRSVGLSTVLGFASGGVIVVIFGWPMEWLPWLYYGGTGTVVGFTLGVLIKWLSVFTKEPA